jgi:hypothetical protein
MAPRAVYLAVRTRAYQASTTPRIPMVMMKSVETVEVFHERDTT